MSHEVQESAVRTLAARHGDDDGLVLLSDWDKSGRLGADKRPGYRALLDAIEGGRCTAVYSYSLSRLARSVAELARLLDDCGRRHIPVRLEADRLDTSTASGILLANVLGSVAQFEADVTSERVRAAVAAKRARGESVASVKCFGEGVDEDVTTVMDAFVEAGSYSGAAKLLNAHGVKPRNSRRGWWPSSVAVVVARVSGTRPKARGVRAGGSAFALARLLRCPSCGTMLTGTRDRNGRRVRYSCRLGSVMPHERTSISEHFILPAIQADVDGLTPTGDRVEQMAADQARRAELEARKARVLDMYEAGHLDREDRDRRLAAIHEALEALDRRRIVVDVPRIDWTWPPADVNRLLRLLIDQVELGPDLRPLPGAIKWRGSIAEWAS